MNGAETMLELDPEILAELEEFAAAIRQTGRPKTLANAKSATAATVARLAIRRGLDQLRQELLPYMGAPILIIPLDPHEEEGDQ